MLIQVVVFNMFVFCIFHSIFLYYLGQSFGGLVEATSMISEDFKVLRSLADDPGLVDTHSINAGCASLEHGHAIA